MKKFLKNREPSPFYKQETGDMCPIQLSTGYKIRKK